MEDADMLVVVLCEQALHFGIGTRRITVRIEILAA
jgi:hypothetical protein